MFVFNDLFENLLIHPIVSEGADELNVVSGYASPSIVYQILDRKKRDAPEQRLKIELIYGMAGIEGVPVQYHQAFKRLTANDEIEFQCYYYIGSGGIHAKTYAWKRDEKPLLAFTGSANFSNRAFFYLKEAATESPAEETLEFISSFGDDVIACTDSSVEEKVRFFSLSPKSVVARQRSGALPENEETGLPSVVLDFRAKDGALPQRSGLNWGQRPEYGRDPNQAYIRVPATHQDSSFFPERGEHFTIITDDGEVIDAVRAQANGKAIECPSDNSVLGAYFRRRMGVASGEPVYLEDLENYGRTDVTFTKVDNETFYMDFSPA